MVPLLLCLQVQEVTPFVVHATFQFGGVLGKQTRLREALLWQDSPAYWTESRLLSIQLHQLRLAPAKLDALSDEQMIAVHLSNMEQVLSQVCGLRVLPCIDTVASAELGFSHEQASTELAPVLAQVSRWVGCCECLAEVDLGQVESARPSRNIAAGSNARPGMIPTREQRCKSPIWTRIRCTAARWLECSRPLLYGPPARRQSWHACS